MKKQPLISSSQGGFTLLEALVALVIFAIIMLGSGIVLNGMMSSQGMSLVDSTIINEMQNRLKSAPALTSSNCPTSLSTNPNFTVGGTNYYIGCAIMETALPSDSTIKIKWYVLAADTTQDKANQCASDAADSTKTPSSDCYIVGK